MDGVCVDDGFEHELFLQGVVRLVNDAHLFEEGRLAGLGGAQQQDLDLVGLVPQLHQDVPIDLFAHHSGLVQFAAEKLGEDGQEATHSSALAT